MITLVGFVLGLLIGIGYALIKELTDTTVKDDEYLTSTLGLTNLGHIATIKMRDKRNMGLAIKPDANDTNNESHKRVRV